MPSVNMSLSTLFLPDVLKRTIVRAGCEERLCVGLDECLEHLNSCDPYKILACVFTTDDTDAVTDRFSQTLLETYCYEQSIPFMKTDLRMMKRILKCIQPHDIDRHDSPSCMIIMKSQNGLINADESELVKAINMSEMMNEETLVLAVNSTPSPTSPSRKIT